MFNQWPFELLKASYGANGRPLYHTLGKLRIVTFATDRPGGFDDAHIAGLLKLLPVLSLVRSHGLHFVIRRSAWRPSASSSANCNPSKFRQLSRTRKHTK
jgi:hypothetical protein